MFPKGPDIHSPEVQSALDDAARGNATIALNTSAVPVATSVGPGTVQRPNGTGSTLTSPYGGGSSHPVAPGTPEPTAANTAAATTANGVSRPPDWQTKVIAANPEIGQPGTAANKAYVQAYKDATTKKGAGNFDPVDLARQTTAALNAAKNPQGAAGSPGTGPSAQAQANAQKAIATANADPDRIAQVGSVMDNVATGKTLHDAAEGLGFTPQAVDRFVDYLASDDDTEDQADEAKKASSIPDHSQWTPGSGKAAAAKLHADGGNTSGMDVGDWNSRVDAAVAAVKANPPTPKGDAAAKPGDAPGSPGGAGNPPATQYAPGNPPVDPKSYQFKPPGASDAGKAPGASGDAAAAGSPAASPDGASASSSAGKSNSTPAYDPVSYHAGHADGSAGRPPQVPAPRSGSSGAGDDTTGASGAADGTNGSDGAAGPAVSGYPKSVAGATDGSDSAATADPGSAQSAPAAAPPPPPQANASSGGGDDSSSGDDED
jgi:hypothetical protein